MAILMTFVGGGLADAPVGGVYTIPYFAFESGGNIDGLRVDYVIYGKLNTAKSNAVLLVPPTSGGRHWAESQIGPGKAYNTDKYFFIVTDAIGNGTSFQPRKGLDARFSHHEAAGDGAEVRDRAAPVAIADEKNRE